MLWNVGLKAALYITTEIIQNTCFFKGSLQSNIFTSSMFVIRKLDFKNALLINIENKWHTITILSHFRIHYFYKQKDVQDGFISSLLWAALKPHNVPWTHQLRVAVTLLTSPQLTGSASQTGGTIPNSITFCTFKCCFFFLYVEGPLSSHFRKAVSWLRLHVSWRPKSHCFIPPSFVTGHTSFRDTQHYLLPSCHKLLTTGSHELWVHSNDLQKKRYLV